MLTKKTKIICTMGPATDDDEVLKDLMRSGMDIARLNFSHGDHEEQLGRIKRIKKFREELNLPIAILLDTKGPEIRTGLLETDDDVELVTGQEYTLTTRDIKGNNEITSITYAELPQDVEAGNTILIDDGLIELKVKEIKDGTDIVCDVINGGLLGSRKGVNVPNVRVNLPSITEKDKADIEFGLENGIDFIAASFIRNAEAVEDIKKEKVYQVLMGARVEEYQEILKGVQGAEITAWWDRAVDIIPVNAGKGAGIEKMLKYYGIDKSQAMAFGDGNNDIEMLKAVGNGIAMANASDDLKAVADEICGDVSEDGIYHYCLEKRLI